MGMIFVLKSFFEKLQKYLANKRDTIGSEKIRAGVVYEFRFGVALKSMDTRKSQLCPMHLDEH